MRSLTALKSSMVNSMFTDRAMAIKCNTALVEPPSTVTSTMAFSNASRVMMSLGLISFSRRFFMASPALKHSSSFFSSIAGVDELYGRLMPIASIAEAIVLAVYIPPHAPGPGQDLLTISCLVSSLILPARNSP